MTRATAAPTRATAAPKRARRAGEGGVYLAADADASCSTGIVLQVMGGETTG
jgi:hypothetical protein